VSKQAENISSALQNLPIREMLSELANGIADAQQIMDQKSIEALKKAAQTASGVNGQTLLELGIIPSFYQFREATIDLSFSLSMKVEEQQSVSLGLNFDKEF